jgi:oxalate decarboxylase/phosphoglucose isomerase-like protein (cupin superfamily)
MLLNNGLSISLSKIDPCGVVLPHLHPRAAQIYYIIKGKFEFGFIQENDANYVQQTIEEGQSTVFPQGAIHYFINTECQESSLVAVANNDDAGRIDIADALFKVLPESIVNAALGGQKPEINKNQVQNIDPAKGTEECRRRCNIS